MYRNKAPNKLHVHRIIMIISNQSIPKVTLDPGILARLKVWHHPQIY